MNTVSLQAAIPIMNLLIIPILLSEMNQQKYTLKREKLLSTKCFRKKNDIICKRGNEYYVIDFFT